jgi:hypothetical protein
MGFEPGSLWQSVVSAALLGTERQPFTVPTATGKLGQVLVQIKSLAAEASLLTTAATLSLYQQAGWMPETCAVATQLPSSLDDLPRCSAHAARLLQQMLQGQYTEGLSEWLTLATQVEQRVPELCLPELLDLGRQRRDLRTAILPVLGQRGRWLAAQNPDWSYAVEVTTAEDWETGNTSARLLYLQDLRLRKPDHARELLQATWKQESAGDRAKFLETFRTGLSMIDESFLEDALADRGKEVRRIAADLLANLPESHLCQRMIKRLESLVKFKKAVGRLYAFDVSLPEIYDATMQQDGIELKPRSAIGERAWWLQQIIGATPLTFWQQSASISIAELLKIAQVGEWKEVFIKGWLLATQRQRHQQWARGLLQHLRDLSSDELQNLLKILTAEQREELMMRLIQSEGNYVRSSYVWTIVLEISRYHEPWSRELVDLWLNRIVQPLLREDINQYQRVVSIWQIRELFKHVSFCVSFDVLAKTSELQLAANHSPLADAIAHFLSILQFRQDVHQALRHSLNYSNGNYKI